MADVSAQIINWENFHGIKNDNNSENIHIQKVYDSSVQIILIGDSRVGKTAILKQSTNKIIEKDKERLTIGIDMDTIYINIRDDQNNINHVTKMTVFATSGQEEFMCDISNYYRTAQGVILIYDITNLSTFMNCAKWFYQLYDHFDDEFKKIIPIILVGNKIDKEDDRKVDTSIGMSFAMGKNIGFIETSALQKRNINELFEVIAIQMWSKQIMQNNLRNKLDEKINEIKTEFLDAKQFFTAEKKKDSNEYTYTSKPTDSVVEIILIGDASVGKTSILKRKIYGGFEDKITSTVGVDFNTIYINIYDKNDNHTTKMKVYDTAGQERYRSVCSQYYRKAQGIVLVYDITNKKTFENCSDWLNIIYENFDEEFKNIIPIILVGNKIDKADHRQVPRDEAEFFAINKKIKFCETSAKENVNIELVFSLVAKEMWERKIIKKNLRNLKNNNIIEKKVNLSIGKKKKSICC